MGVWISLHAYRFASVSAFDSYGATRKRYILRTRYVNATLRNNFRMLLSRQNAIIVSQV